MKVEFYYSSKDEPSMRFPIDIDNALKQLDALKQAGVPVESVDVAGMDDVFRIYHKALVGPSARKKAVFGMKGGLEPDFGRSCPALYVYEDAAERYPSDAYPRSDLEKGLIGIESALEDLVAARKAAPTEPDADEEPGP